MFHQEVSIMQKMCKLDNPQYLNEIMNLGIYFTYEGQKWLATIYTTEIVDSTCPYGICIDTIDNAINSRLVDLSNSYQIEELHQGQEVEVKHVEPFILQEPSIKLEGYEFLRIKIRFKQI